MITQWGKNSLFKKMVLGQWGDIQRNAVGALTHTIYNSQFKMELPVGM